VGSLPDVTVNMDAAFDKEASLWHRRPLELQCYPDHSDSTISRDMLLGLAWYAYFNKRLDISEQVIKYALSHWCIMGKAKNWKVKLSRCFMTPGLLATFAWISFRLGGPSRGWLRWIPIWISGNESGFEAHLSVTHALLRRRLCGRDDNRRALMQHAKRQPHNPLFMYAVDQYRAAAKILLDRKYWPHDKLPTNHDRKSSWLPQRDFGPDWAPDTKNPEITHSGGDLLFCAALLLNKI